MNIECNQCQEKIEFEGARPNFCASCGSMLVFEDQEAVTYQGSETISTQVPNRDPQSLAEIPEVIDGFRLGKKLGQGGMGTVWEATHLPSGRMVALKLLSQSLESQDSNVDRFNQEAKLAAALSHPRTTFIFGAGQHGDNPYIVMELMPGATLQTLVEREGKLESNVAVDHIIDIIDGLQAAHKLGIIHRDVKPSNCFIDGQGRSKVGDFGLSKSLGGDVNLTQTGAFLGTPLFAAPEQVRGEKVDERTDIYSVGATLFYLLTGKGPFQGDAFSIIAQIVTDPPTQLRALEPDAPLALGQIVAKTLEKDPANRYQSLNDLKEALTPYSSRGLEGVDLWRRFAAYMFDLFCISTLTAIVSTSINLVVTVRTKLAGGTPEEMAELQEQASEFTPYLKLIQVGLFASYLLFAEWRWGRSLGKRIFGLRVVQLNGEKPKFWQGLVRVAFIPLACGLVLIELLSKWLFDFQLIDGQTITSETLLVGLLLGLPTTLFCFSCFLSIKKTNGYRAWHDLATGTHVTKVAKSWLLHRQTVFPSSHYRQERRRKGFLRTICRRRDPIQRTAEGRRDVGKRSGPGSKCLDSYGAIDRRA